MGNTLVILAQHSAVHDVLPFAAAADCSAAVVVVVDAQRVADAIGISEGRKADGAAIRLRKTVDY
jgi:hypothetical protein